MKESKAPREFHADTESLDDALSKCDLGDGHFARVYQYPHVDSLPRLTKFIEHSAFTALEARCAKLRAALEFYANRINWNHAAFDGIAESCIRYADLEPAVPEKTRIYNGTGIRCFEGGKRARAALAEDEGAG